VHNHKVVSVRDGGYADAYDITVIETENFALNSGVFVHNSKDVSDCVAGVAFHCNTDKRVLDSRTVTGDEEKPGEVNIVTEIGGIDWSKAKKEFKSIGR